MPTFQNYKLSFYYSNMHYNPIVQTQNENESCKKQIMQNEIVKRFLLHSLEMYENYGVQLSSSICWSSFFESLPNWKCDSVDV